MDPLLILIGILFGVSVLFSKISDKYGVPALLLFLVVGMIFGSDGLKLFDFNNAELASDIGTITLIYILFSGGFNTDINQIRPILARGLVLATAGVIISAAVTAVFAYYILHLSVLESALCGAIISSTDAAAVFCILRSKNIKLRNNLGELLEFESGSNDPMAIFLTMTIISLATAGTMPPAQDVALTLSLQFIIGGLAGWAVGSAIPLIFNRINLSSSGLYPVLLMAIVLLLFGVTNEIGGNGYIAVYGAGIFANRRDFIYKKSIASFFDSIAWLMQIFIFLTLGLLVFPKELGDVALNSLLLALALMFVARPVSVFLCTPFSKFNFKEKTFISWVGFRGVVPIVLATQPLSANLPCGQLIFNVIFFIVIISVLVQGSTFSLAAKSLGVIAPPAPAPTFNKSVPSHNIRQMFIGRDSKVINKNLAELELPAGFFVLMARRSGLMMKVSSAFVFKESDFLLIMCEDDELYEKTILTKF